jgi:hypothetical protein
MPRTPIWRDAASGLVSFVSLLGALREAMAAAHHAPRPLWFLEYNVALVPAGGAMVAACNAAPVSGHMKEAAGRSFHHKVRVVQGLAPLGACTEAQSIAGDTASRRRRREPAAVPLSPVLTPTLPLRRTRQTRRRRRKTRQRRWTTTSRWSPSAPAGALLNSLLPASTAVRRSSHSPMSRPCSTDDLEAWERTMRRKRKGSKVDNWDYYAMLELQDVRWRASVADLKEAFKRVSLRCAIRRACAEAPGGASRCCASRVYAPPSAWPRCLAEKRTHRRQARDTLLWLAAARVRVPRPRR